MALGYITLGRSVSNHNRDLKRIQKFNRKLAGFLGDPASIETANLLDKRAKVSRSPSYEIRSQVCKLHEVLSDSWGKTCRMSHRTNLGLSAFRDHLPDQSCLLEKWEAYILIASHENPDVWQQNKIRVVDR